MARRGRRGEGSVYYSKADRRWIAKFPLGVAAGKRRDKRVKCRTEREAKAELESLRRLYGAGVEPALDTLDRYLHEWLDGIRSSVRSSTFTSYQGHVELHISPLLGGVVTVRLTHQDVRRLINDRLKAGKSPTTVRRIVTTLQMALGQGVREGRLPYNVANGQRLPRIESKAIRALTWDDADRILEAVRGDRFEALYVLLLFSGMRLGEATALNWRDIDLGARTLFIRSGKTRASVRVVPLATEAWEALSSHKLKTNGEPSSPVFTGQRRGERLRGDVITHAFPRLLERAGLPRMRVHDLRHGTATLLLSQGVPMRNIADLLGHSSPSVTMNVYAHVTEEMRRAAIAALERR